MRRFLLASAVLGAIAAVCILVQRADPQIRQFGGHRLVSMGLQDIAQVVHGTKGTVWFVATDGAATNDGLSPDTSSSSWATGPATSAP